MCVDLSDYNRYLNQVWYRTQIPQYQQPEWPNSHKLKIQDGGGCYLEFRKNVNNIGLDKDMLHQIIWEDAPRPYCFVFFLVTPPGRTVALILTLNGSNNVFPPKTVPFGVSTMGDVIWGKYSPKTSQNGA